MQTKKLASSAPGFPGSRSIKLYRPLLRLYPREFRNRFGEEILQVIQDDLQDNLATGGPVKLAIFWLAAFLNLLTTAVQEHRDHSTNPLKKLRGLQKIGGILTAGIVQILASALAYILIGYIYIKIDARSARSYPINKINWQRSSS